MDAERARALLDEFERVKVISAREGARYRVFLLAAEPADPLELAEAADRAIAAAGRVAGLARLIAATGAVAAAADDAAGLIAS